MIEMIYSTKKTFFSLNVFYTTVNASPWHLKVLSRKIWLKMVSFEMPLSKGGYFQWTSPIPLPVKDLYSYAPPHTMISNWEPNCQWRTQLQLWLCFYIIQRLAKAWCRNLESIPNSAVNLFLMSSFFYQKEEVQGMLPTFKTSQLVYVRIFFLSWQLLSRLPIKKTRGRWDSKELSQDEGQADFSKILRILFI